MSGTETYQGHPAEGNERSLPPFFANPLFKLLTTFPSLIDHQPHLTFLLCDVVRKFA